MKTLRRETNWDGLSKYSDELLECLSDFCASKAALKQIVSQLGQSEVREDQPRSVERDEIEVTYRA